jgi:hypothetical protein
MHFEAQQSFIKNDGYLFMKTIYYRDDTNFIKKHKSPPDMGWLLLCGTRDSSHLDHENNLGRPETGSFIY